MTPAIDLLRKSGVAFQVHAYRHEPGSRDYGAEAAQRLGLDADRVFKTLLAATDTGELVVGIVPVSGTLDLKALALASGSRKCEMANPSAAQRATGYLVGGISPLGQKKKHRTFIDASAQALPLIHVSAGRRGLEISLAPSDLLALCDGAWADLGRSR